MLAAMASIYADARANVCGRYFPFSLKNLPFPKIFFPIFKDIFYSKVLNIYYKVCNTRYKVCNTC